MSRAFRTSILALAGAVWCAAAVAQNDSSTPTPPPQPAAATPDTGAEVIHLHMPVHKHIVHRVRPAAREQSEPASVDAIGAEPPAPSPAPASTPAPPAATEAPTPTRAKAPTQAPATPAIPFTFGEDTGSPPAISPPSPPPSLKTASLPPRATPAHAGTPHGASGDEHAGLTRRGAVLFEKGVSDPSPAQFKGVKLLAGDLGTALESGASRVQLEAYGGAPGDKSSDARRLSLKRALAVRQLLIDSGVPSSRIDVRAMGGIDDKGPTDRVDVFVRT